ncbi:MAG: hypothetical protein H7210_00805 [Pyrinomonadaceae bacterium]|nr:hypothetical protein [Phycisphaerales bacterium]
MTDLELQHLADALSKVVRPHLERSAPLREALGLFGKWLCEETSKFSSPPDAAAVSAPVEPIKQAPVARVAAPAAVSGPRLPMSSAIVPLKLGDTVVHVPLTGTTQEIGRARQSAMAPKAHAEDYSAFAEAASIDLALVEERSLLKAAACRLFIERRGISPDSAEEMETRTRMNHMIAQAKAMPNCFLWVFWRERVQPDDQTLRQIAENYDAHAAAVGLMRRLTGSGEKESSSDLETAFYLLAEANSSLRVAMESTWLTDHDRDQADIHTWLRQETASRRIYIGQYMTVDNPADPAEAAHLIGRIREFQAKIEDRAGRVKSIKSALTQVRYHSNMIVKNAPEPSENDWRKISQALEKLRLLAVPHTDRRFTEALGAQAGLLCPPALAEELGLTEVLAHVGAATSAAEEPDSQDETPERGWSAQVGTVREWLRGRRMVLMGGERNVQAIERLKDAFELSDVDWVPLTEHGSALPMRGPIQRPDTAVVVVILKLAGHLHADEAQTYSAEAGKPCVLLTGGYNPERVAQDIVQQASDRLKTRRVAASTM